LGSPRNGEVNAVAFADPKTGLAVGSHGLILRTTTGGTTWVKGDGPRPEGIASQTSLEQNFPNPFNPGTVIRYDVATAGQVNLTIYDILGRQVMVAVDELKPPGRYEVAFDGARLASGVYIYRLTAGPYVETRKMLLLK
jgi:hypothetical protein